MIYQILPVLKFYADVRLIPILFIAFTLFGCSNSSSQNDASNNEDMVDDKITDEISDENANNYNEYVQENDLKSIIKNNELAFEQYNFINQGLSNQDSIKSIEEVELILKSRDSLITLLEADKNFSQFMEVGTDYETYEEFKRLGIHVVESEGIFFELDQAPLLIELIEKYASEPELLKNQIENLLSTSNGSEYPYLDLGEELEIIPLVEELIAKYPQHPFNSKALEILNSALTPLVDVHLVKNDHDESHIVGSLYVEAYPGLTDINYHKKFVAKGDSTRFSKVVERILGSISTIDYTFDKIYYIEIPEIKSDSIFADQAISEEFRNLPNEVKQINDIFTYLWLGIDVPHVLHLGDNESPKLVYRFFNGLAPAQKSLEEIKKVIPSAKLVKHHFEE